MSGLGEQIAVLDGLGALDPNDGRIGQRRASVTQYARAKMPGVTYRNNVIDASEGANYSGGSSYAPRLPLMPSSVGLAGFGNIPSVLPTRRHVVDYSGGAQYSGGSSWVPGLPLLPSSAGLADAIIRGGYGRAGLGAAFIQGGYGRAGLGSTGSYVDEDLAGAAEAMEVHRALDPNDGRIGQYRPTVDEYGKQIMPGVLARSNVIDASEGANYSGGSSYAVGLPLMPSSVGLAGLDAFNIKVPPQFNRIASNQRVAQIKRQAGTLAKKVQRVAATQGPQACAPYIAKIRYLMAQLAQARGVRAQVVQSAAARAAAMRAIPSIARPTASQAAYATRQALWGR